MIEVVVCVLEFVDVDRDKGEFCFAANKRDANCGSNERNRANRTVGTKQDFGLNGFASHGACGFGLPIKAKSFLRIHLFYFLDIFLSIVCTKSPKSLVFFYTFS